MENNIENIFYEYNYSLDYNVLLKYFPEMVAYTIDVIYNEAIRTYKEDLSLDKNFVKNNSITTSFSTDYSLFDENKIFFSDKGYFNKWYVAITIDDSFDKPLDFEHHNKFNDGNIVDGKLCNFKSNMDVFASHTTWKIKYFIVISKVVSDAYNFWLSNLNK